MKILHFDAGTFDFSFSGLPQVGFKKVSVKTAIVFAALALVAVFSDALIAAPATDSARADFFAAQQKYVEALRTYGSADQRSEACRTVYLLALKRYEEAKLAQVSPSSGVDPGSGASGQAPAARAASGLEKAISIEIGSGPLPPPPGVQAVTCPAPIGRDILLKFRYGTVDASALNLRSGPGTANEVTRVLPAGTRFGIEDYRSGWYRVRLSDGTSGWVAGWLVTTCQNLPAEPAPPSPGIAGLAGRFIETGSITSRYGYRSDPFTGEKKFHSGIDIGAPRGTPVLSLGSGKVVFADWSGGYGRLVKVRYDSGYEAFYAHLDDFAGVKVGDRVSRGDRVGSVDSSGRSTGHHLHFEVRDPSGKTMDPQKVEGVVI